MKKRNVNDFIISSWLVGVPLEEIRKSHKKGKISEAMLSRFIFTYKILDNKALIVLKEWQKQERRLR